MSRVIAICQGGTLDGKLISVEVGDSGEPGALLSRQEITGELYQATRKIELLDEHLIQFASMEHEEAWIYERI